eukprot:364671-Chlamydomonas_euryale.AAC.8
MCLYDPPNRAYAFVWTTTLHPYLAGANLTGHGAKCSLDLVSAEVLCQRLTVTVQPLLVFSCSWSAHARQPLSPRPAKNK